MACPACGGRLRAWSRARSRTVRLLAAGTRTIRPRRARCQDCTRTQVLLPSACLPRRADATEVIATALRATASGSGYRHVAG
ncbi:DUF6431 domain-containing protein [Kineosporia sp. NBRC 101677]|uniref:DUF6431 domain-containing protein n=1 Tax=Kineosporia sp. NBRC 101677 TaxID=3032197 RepID=UPI0033250397